MNGRDTRYSVQSTQYKVVGSRQLLRSAVYVLNTGYFVLSTEHSPHSLPPYAPAFPFTAVATGVGRTVAVTLGAGRAGSAGAGTAGAAAAAVFGCTSTPNFSIVNRLNSAPNMLVWPFSPLLPKLISCDGTSGCLLCRS